MANEITGTIKKIKLSNGNIYSIFDAGALRLNDQNILVTGNTVVDALIIDGNLSITEIDDVPVADNISNVLVQGNNGIIQKRSTDYLLKDIGGVSYDMDDITGTLSLNIGKSN